jgi:hypothetical protein
VGDHDGGLRGDEAILYLRPVSDIRLRLEQGTVERVPDRRVTNRSPLLSSASSHLVLSTQLASGLEVGLDVGVAREFTAVSDQQKATGLGDPPFLHCLYNLSNKNDERFNYKFSY